MKITKKDVGRKVRMRDGSIQTITRYNNSTLTNYPVVLSGFGAYTTSGYYYSWERSDKDIVDFVDEKIDLQQEIENIQLFLGVLKQRLDEQQRTAEDPYPLTYDDVIEQFGMFEREDGSLFLSIHTEHERSLRYLQLAGNCISPILGANEWNRMSRFLSDRFRKVEHGNYRIVPAE